MSTWAAVEPILADSTGRGRGVLWLNLDGDVVPELLVGNFWPIDLDFDGDLDLLCFQGREHYSERKGAVLLYENTTRRKGIALILRSTEGPPEGLGAVVELEAAGGWRRQEVRCVGDPYSSMVAPLHFEVGDEAGPLRLRVRWVDGRTQYVRLPGSGRAYLIREGHTRARLMPANARREAGHGS